MTINDKETTLKKLGLTLAMIMSAGFAAMPAQAGDSAVAGDIGVYSQYMWRGMQASAGTSVQGDYGLDIGGGLSANVWFAAPLGNVAPANKQGANVGGNKTEFDYTVDYSGEAGGVSYSVGAIAYTYLNGAAGNATEVYAGVGFGPVSATYYYAVAGSWKKDAYLDVALSQSLGGFDLGADFGVYLASTSAAKSNEFPTTKNGLGHIDLSVSKDVSVGDATMSPSLMISIPQYSGKPKNANQVVAGVNFAY